MFYLNTIMGLQVRAYFKFLSGFFAIDLAIKTFWKGIQPKGKSTFSTSENANVAFFTVVKVLFYIGCDDRISDCCERFNIPIDAEFDKESESAFTFDPATFFQKL